MSRSFLRAEDFTIGWICALPVERAAAEHMLDDRFDEYNFGSRYTVGRIGGHYVVIVCLPEGLIGASSAANVATQMKSDFKSIRTYFIVGIGGGVPSFQADVRLGDVVISRPNNGHGGVVQYDFGKAVADGRLVRNGFLNAPPTELLDLVAKFKSEVFQRRDKISTHLDHFKTLPEFEREHTGPDILFRADSIHSPGSATCENCDSSAIIHRAPRDGLAPVIHYGTIASANQVMRDGITRDAHSTELGGILCYEMEAAGLMNIFPGLVIRGICDYADQHKNKSWQPYAAAVASACTKELLSLFPETDNEARKRFDEDLSAMKKAFPSPDPVVDYKRAINLRKPETGLWFLESKRYVDWKKSASTIWLYGIPGSGKTILSSGVISDINSQVANDPNGRLAYFYFVFDDTQKQITEFMLRSLIYQLLDKFSRIPSSLRRLFASSQNIDFEDLMEVLKQMIFEFPHTYIILDALDECSDRAALMSFVQTISDWKLEQLHLLLTSRRERQIDDCLESIIPIKSQVCLQTDLVDPDIQKYVSSRLLDDKSLAKWQNDAEARMQIERTVADRARGMFRLATCHLDRLAKCRNRLQLQAALADLPPTLTAMYDRILQGIDSNDHEYTIRILRWLALSERPLLIEEVAEAAAIDPLRHPAFDPQEVLQDPFEVLDICSSLVAVNSAPWWTTIGWSYSKSASTQTVSLAHFSVKEYLTSSSMRMLRSSELHMNASISHQLLAMSCVGYLFRFENLKPFNQDTVEQARLTKYCIWNWAIHAQKVEDRQTLADQILRFLSSRAPFINFNRLYNIDDPTDLPQFGKNPADIPTPLYVATFFNLTTIVNLLLEAGADPNERSGKCHMALQLAARTGHYEIADRLVEAGADVRAIGGTYHTALHAAASTGHSKIVQRLLKEGSDVSTHGGVYGSVLEAAIWGGSTDVMDQLLAAGANVNVRVDHGKTVLHTAASKDAAEMLDRLLTANADLNAQGVDGTSPLYLAASYGRFNSVSRLLAAGADIELRGGDCGTALHAAAYRCHETIVQALLDNGGDVHAQVEKIGTALHAAVCALPSSSSRVLTMQWLLYAGAKVDAYSDNAGTPLHAAAHRGHHDAVMELLDWGADVHREDRLGYTAAQLAKFKGYFEIARRLDV